jgi:hypothetical protein
MDPESSSRALSAVNDLVELMRLAQSAADRVEREVHGASYEEADLIAHELQRVRRLAERLKGDTERLVRREEATNTARGHPLRRASDRRIGRADSRAPN